MPACRTYGRADTQDPPSMPQHTHKSPHEHSHLLFGLLLLLLGAVLLAYNLGFEIPIKAWKLWPLPLIGLGLVGLLVPSRHLDRSGGLWMLTVGLYGAVGTFNWFGLGWEAWPVFLIAAGLSLI